MSASTTTAAPAAPAPTTASAPASAPAAASAPTPAPATAAPVATPAAVAPIAPAVDAAAIRAEAASAERKRVLGIQALARSANDDVVTACVNDPTCTVEAAALRIAQDTQAKAQARLTARAENDRTLPSGPAPAATDPQPGAQLVAALRLIRPEKTVAAAR
jgi:pyruvate dehydrogenase E2 component (dihydrolipoamide acetyltransferase)